MRYCVSGRQPYSVLKKADEIKVAYVDRDRIMDFVEKINDKVIILEVSNGPAEWDTWQMYSEKFAEFHIALSDLGRCKEFVEHGINWYWPYPITSFYELNAIMEYHPSYIMVGPPLSFNLDKLFNERYYKDSTEQVPVRMVANNARPAYLPRTEQNGICGQWIRPEDVDVYATRVDCLEFEGVDLNQEEVLLKVYKEQRTWPGNLNLILKNFNYNVDNRAIPEDLAAARMHCGQKCFSGSYCHLCNSAIQFAEQLRKIHFERNKKDNIDNN